MKPLSSYARTSTDRSAFSLHDCRAKSAELSLRDSALTFGFPDGIFTPEYGRDWPNTGPAAVTFALSQPPEEAVRCDLFAREGDREFRQSVPAETLIAEINRGAWELEFLYRYDGYEEVFYVCYLWQSAEPYVREAHLFIETKEILFRWDEPAGNRQSESD